MKKSIVRWIIILATVLVAYHVIIFALPISKGSVFWVSYVFTMIAIAMQIYVIHIAFYQGTSVKSKFYGFPIAKIGVSYLVVQLLFSLIFMTVSTFVPVWLPLIMAVILLCTTVIGLVAADATRDEVERQETQIKKNTSVMRELQAKVDSMVSLTKDGDVFSALHKLAEEFRFSDPVSNSVLQEIESKLTIRIDKLREAVQSNNTEVILSEIQSIKEILVERNRLCKFTKQNI